jgi:Reverse transcriptase (RNA-dependent DNA polymerase)
VVATSTVPAVRFVRVRHAGTERRFVLLDVPTRERYVELVARSAGAIEELLMPSVMANRVASWNVRPPELVLRPWRLERRLFASRLAALAARRRTIAFADVRRCYASMSPSIVGDALDRAGIPTACEVARFLACLERIGVEGLPVGPDASAVLANAVLAQVDRSLLESGIEHLRWVDDVVLSGGDASAALSVFRTALATIGLRPNEAKTRILADATGLGSTTTVSGGP